jgi:hypothetical protein
MNSIGQKRDFGWNYAGARQVHEVVKALIFDDHSGDGFETKSADCQGVLSGTE